MNYLIFSLIGIVSIIPFTYHEIFIENPPQKMASVLMPITNYSELDSCHYPVKGGCLTASGTIASETTIACPRHWPLGTKVLIEGKEYICEDRYNSNLSDRIDIWVGYGKQAHKEALEFGLQKHQVIVLL